jgi:hypothetical protein
LIKDRPHDQSAFRPNRCIAPRVQALAFLAAQAARLSTTNAVVEAKLIKYGADRVKAAANLAALP